MITSFFDIEAVMLAFLTTCVAVTVLALITSQVCKVLGWCLCQHKRRCVFEACTRLSWPARCVLQTSNPSAALHQVAWLPPYLSLLEGMLEP